MEEEGEEITGKRAGPECGPPGGTGRPDPEPAPGATHLGAR
jgi:hypothetical protein